MPKSNAKGASVQMLKCTDAKCTSARAKCQMHRCQMHISIFPPRSSFVVFLMPMPNAKCQSQMPKAQACKCSNALMSNAHLRVPNSKYMNQPILFSSFFAWLWSNLVMFVLVFHKSLATLCTKLRKWQQQHNGLLAVLVGKTKILKCTRFLCQF